MNVCEIPPQCAPLYGETSWSTASAFFCISWQTRQNCQLIDMRAAVGRSEPRIAIRF